MKLGFFRLTVEGAAYGSGVKSMLAILWFYYQFISSLALISYRHVL